MSRVRGPVDRKLRQTISSALQQAKAAYHGAELVFGVLTARTGGVGVGQGGLWKKTSMSLIGRRNKREM